MQNNPAEMVPNPSLLLIDDDPELGELIRGILSPYELHHACAKSQAFLILEKQKIDLILLDVEFPDASGFQVCHEIASRSDCMETPIVMVSSHGSKAEIALGLGSGADDYIVKPFDPLEFKYRIDARLRRRHLFSRTYVAGSFHFDLALQRCEIRDVDRVTGLELTTAEFLIFFLLAKHPDQVFTRGKIVHEVWKRKGFSIDPKGINTHIAHIRRKLGPVKHVIQSFYGRGYCFIPIETKAS